MLCHGELVRLRPTPRYLTSFYLMISAGGALGGLSVSLVAPQVFNTFAEWKIGLAGGFVLAATVAFVLAGSTDSARPGWRGPRRLRPSLPGRAACRRPAGGFAGPGRNHSAVAERRTVVCPSSQKRDFYGVLTVTNDCLTNRGSISACFTTAASGMASNSSNRRRVDAAHLLLGKKRRRPGAGILQHESAHTGDPLRVGVVGLGVGTLATYVYLPWHTIRFYEINPEVPRLAESHFTYLSEARGRGATVEIVLGDGRLSLERELKQGSQGYDLLVLDAFSSDSIPMHLLTKEAFDIYLPHLAPQGALAVHVSNRNLELAPVVSGWPSISGSMPFGS